jgi:hypothetical protein
MVDQVIPSRGERRNRQGDILPNEPAYVPHFAIVPLKSLVYKVGLVKSLDEPASFKVITHDAIKADLSTCVGSAGTPVEEEQL